MTQYVQETGRCELDLLEIATFIATGSPAAARRFLDAVEAAENQLLNNPFLGTAYPSDRPELRPLRVWTMPSFRRYLIFYRAMDWGIEVVRIMHGSRDWPHELNVHPE